MERVREVAQERCVISSGREKLGPRHKGSDEPRIYCKSFQLSPSNFKQWRGDGIDTPEQLAEQMQMFAKTEKDSAGVEHMFYELLLKFGQELTTPVELLDIALSPPAPLPWGPPLPRPLSRERRGPNPYNLIYSLDPVRAYEMDLVKQIGVDSVIELKDANQAYVEVESFKAGKSSLSAKLSLWVIRRSVRQAAFSRTAEDQARLDDHHSDTAGRLTPSRSGYTSAILQNEKDGQMATTISEEEVRACQPVPLNPQGFNSNTEIPFGLQTDHIRSAMQEFLDFLSFVNTSLLSKQIPRLESFLMPANFSSMVGEFMNAAIPKYCSTVVKNIYHNGHPDLIPSGMFPRDKIQHHTMGIEIKGSRYTSGWQGHNAEECWLMVFVFDSNRPRDALEDIPPRSFRFVGVYGAQLAKEDWRFSGRSETSRRTITASVTRIGFDKMVSNWIYKADV